MDVTMINSFLQLENFRGEKQKFDELKNKNKSKAGTTTKKW